MVLDELFDRPSQRPGAEVRIVSLIDEQSLRLIGEFQLQPMFAEALPHLFQFVIHDDIDSQ